MKKIIFAIILLVVAFGIYKLAGAPSSSGVGEPVVYKDVLKVSTPLPNEVIGNPLVVKGFAKGWMFEASFPVTLVDWDGKIIAQGPAQADADPVTGEVNWMTADYVPFTATLTYTSPYVSTNEASKRGSIILKKDNPSDMRELDDSYELPIRFAE